MVPTKSLDVGFPIIAALLRDVHNTHGVIFNTRSLRLTLNRVEKRLHSEGFGFLSKSMPRLGKALHRALSSTTPLNCAGLGFALIPGTNLPRFLGEFFSRVFDTSGTVLQFPCVTSVRVLSQVLFVFYKYELPYTAEQEQEVVSKFVTCETDLSTTDESIESLDRTSRSSNNYSSKEPQERLAEVAVARMAQGLLKELFRSFKPLSIHPRHGPGAVATKQRLWGKYQWTNVASKITDMYPFDAYFCASLGHVCDTYHSFADVGDKDLPARVILVPKDSRGPRLISCEPVDYQWVQQGLGRAIVELVESHPLTRWNVHFTNQQPNQFGALLGSRTGKYATLDLKEASDRVSLKLVRLLFPEKVRPYLEACRSSATVLPDGKVLPLRKFAPMGSCLCFPIMALTIWAILTAAAPDSDTRESILVYGDDVIVPTHYAVYAMSILESFGLAINRDKSCTSGLFRESCGTDAFAGVNVTPVRIRTVWSSTPSPNVYASWIAYANSFWRKQYYSVYDCIVEWLHSIYGAIPSKAMHLACPSLEYVPHELLPKRRRVNKDLQKVQYNVWDVKAPSISKRIDGWSMLLRFFSESGREPVMPFAETDDNRNEDAFLSEEHTPFSVSQYTDRNTSLLVRRWR